MPIDLYVFYVSNNTMGIYYRIWVDAIVFEKTKNRDIGNWKFFTILPLSLLHGINALTIMIILNILNIKIDPFIHFDIFPGTMLDNFFHSS